MSQEQPLRLLIVESRFYDDIADELLAGAKDALEAHEISYDVVTVPGAFEIPAAIAMAEDAAHRPMGKAYDGYVALGCVLRGPGFHFEIIAGESAHGLMRLSVDHGLCIGNGIIAADSEAQALQLAQESGGDAARACLALVELRGRLGIYS